MTYPRASGSPRWLMRIISVVAVPVFTLGVLELGLRLIGFGYPTRFWVPSVVNGVEYRVPNTSFTYQFFPSSLARAPLPQRLKAEKGEDTFRIFLFGESAAYGDPEPSYGIGRQLEVLLNERYKDTDFEVICTAMTAINSHAILPIARECAKLDGDLWIIYMGNNEMVGAYGAGTVFSAKAPPLWAVRSLLVLKSTRIGQLLERGVDGMRSATPSTDDWEGIGMFTRNPLGHDDPQRLTAYRNFQGNLRDILEMANRRKIPVVLSTVASNLKDCAPFLSIQEEETASAEFHFQQGNQFFLSGQIVEAKAAFEQARDYDALAVRADSRINNIIREQAKAISGDRIRLLDADTDLAAISPHGILGKSLFYEHVHLTVEGNYQLARLLADEVAVLLPDGIAANDLGIWAEPDIIERKLAITLWDQYRLWNNMLNRSIVPPFSGQSNHGQHLAFLKQQTEAVIARIGPNTPREDRQLYEAALALDPDDVTLRACYGQYLEAMGARAEAIEQMRRVCELLPDLEWPHFFHAELLRRDGRRREARAGLQRALEIRPDFAQARKLLEAL